tara:strand:+ start:163 stop:291 length:129 start_codon:yes stop_codon:yes gene_type:complete
MPIKIKFAQTLAILKKIGYHDRFDIEIISNGESIKVQMKTKV